jgi:hypothetical protein
MFLLLSTKLSAVITTLILRYTLTFVPFRIALLTFSQNPPEFVADPKGIFLEGFKLDYDQRLGYEARGGLGHLPSSIASLDNLLLFNTEENPYKEYSPVDALLMQDRKRRAEMTEATQVDEFGDVDVFDGDILREIDNADLAYRPVLENMRDARSALPAQLPGIGPVASNVTLRKNGTWVALHAFLNFSQRRDSH